MCDSCGVAELLHTVDAVLESLPDPTDGPVLVGIEGFMAAGKSALAAAVAARLHGSTLIHADEFYVPEQRDWRSWSAKEGYERYFDHRRLESELLVKLRAEDTASFRRFDWATRTMDGWVTVAPTGVVLVEGIYLLRQRLRQYWDFAVFVDTPREVRIARAYSRGETDIGWTARWMQAEDYYEQVEHPAAAADVVVPGHDAPPRQTSSGL